MVLLHLVAPRGCSPKVVEETAQGDQVNMYSCVGGGSLCRLGYSVAHFVHEAGLKPRNLSAFAS